MPKSIAVTTALIALLVPASADARSSGVHCSRYANKARVATSVVHRPLFATTLATRWCYDGRHVVRLTGVQVLPTLTTLGSLLTWEFKGTLPDASENVVFSRAGTRRAGYRVRRVVQWQRCTGSCFSYYLELNSFLYADGHAAPLNRARK